MHPQERNHSERGCRGDSRHGRGHRGDDHSSSKRPRSSNNYPLDYGSRNESRRRNEEQARGGSNNERGRSWDRPHERHHHSHHNNNDGAPNTNNHMNERSQFHLESYGNNNDGGLSINKRRPEVACNIIQQPDMVASSILDTSSRNSTAVVALTLAKREESGNNYPLSYMETDSKPSSNPNKKEDGKKHAAASITPSEYVAVKSKASSHDSTCVIEIGEYDKKVFDFSNNSIKHFFNSSWHERIESQVRFEERANIPEEIVEDDQEWKSRKIRAAEHAIERVMMKLKEGAREEKMKDGSDSYDTSDSASSEESNVWDQVDLQGTCEDSYVQNLCKKSVTKFFHSVRYYLHFTIGFDALGLRPNEEVNCSCPCSPNAVNFQEQFEVKYIVSDAQSNEKYNKACRKKKSPSGIMDHLRTLASQDCMLHYGLMEYMEHLYCKDRGSYRGGIGHKAMYNVMDANFKAAEAAETRDRHQQMKKFEAQVKIERKLRLLTEKKLGEQRQRMDLLKSTNKEQFKKIKELEDFKKALNIKQKEESVKLSDYMIKQYRRQYRSFFETIRGSMMKTKSLAKNLIGSIEEGMDDQLVLELENDGFNLQNFFDRFYKEWSYKGRDVNNATLLFSNLTLTSTNDEVMENYFAYKILEEWNCQIQNEYDYQSPKGKYTTKKAMEQKKMDTAVDAGGPSRQFLSECWRQMADLVLIIEVTKEKIIVSRKLVTDEMLEVKIRESMKALNMDVNPKTVESLIGCVKFSNKTRKSKIITTEDVLNEKIKLICGNDVDARVKLFEMETDGIVPITDEMLNENIRIAVEAREKNIKHESPKKREEFVKQTCVDLVKQAESYYRAIGRIMLHSLATFHTMSSTAMSSFYQNWFFRDCSPGDEGYHKHDIAYHLQGIGANLHQLKSTIGVEYDYIDGKPEIVTEETFFTKFIKDRFIQSRRISINALKEGLTLNGSIPISENLCTMPLDVVQRLMFSNPLIRAKDVIEILNPKYCVSWEQADVKAEDVPGIREEQQKFFETTLIPFLKKKEGLASEEQSDFLNSFLSFCTGYGYLPDRAGNPEYGIDIEFELLHTYPYPKSHACPEPRSVLVLPGKLCIQKDFITNFEAAVLSYKGRFDMQ